MESRPVWAEIDLSAIKHNFRQVQKLIKPSTKIMAIVKANAYGHGAIEVGKTLLEEGADYLAVAFLEEALQLRIAGLTCPILILGWTPPEEYKIALANRITLTIYDYQEAQNLSQLAKRIQTEAIIHLKIDTGMSRLGIPADENNIMLARQIIDLPFLRTEGIYTHFAKADEKNKSYAFWQLKRFLDFAHGLEAQSGKKILLKHAANSAAIIDLPEAYLDLVRPGIILYGLQPSPEVDLKRVELKPALSLYARISRVQSFPKGTLVSYGGIYQTPEEVLIATIPIGYADGYSRLLSGKVQVIIKQKRYPIIGKICMDQCMINLSQEKGIKAGDKVTLIGKEKESLISMDEIADILGTINYEVACMISSRVPREYKLEC